MPFTFAHPAIVVPLKKMKPGWFSLSGLVAGSIAPDFEYFFKFRATSTISESLLGIFTFNLPVTIGLSLLFHLIVRNPLIRHLPYPYDRRFSGFLQFNFLHYLRRHPWRFLSAALVGISSHLLLDILTSPDIMTSSFHKLQHLGLHFSLAKEPLQAGIGEQSFVILERSLSVAGLGFTAWILSQVNYPAKNFLREHPQQKVRFYGVFVAFLIVGILAAVQWLPYQLSAAQLIVYAISASLYSLVFTSLIFRR